MRLIIEKTNAPVIVDEEEEALQTSCSNAHGVYSLRSTLSSTRREAPIAHSTLYFRLLCGKVGRRLVFKLMSALFLFFLLQALIDFWNQLNHCSLL